ncbi:hypothetical protein D3C71_1766540 [compost metagenome]
MGTSADGLELELGIEGRDFEHADIGHAEHVGDRFDRGLRYPAVLLLRPHQQRNDRGLLAAFRILLDCPLCPSGVFAIERECGRLNIVFG